MPRPTSSIATPSCRKKTQGDGPTRAQVVQTLMADCSQLMDRLTVASQGVPGEPTTRTSRCSARRQQDRTERPVCRRARTGCSAERHRVVIRCSRSQASAELGDDDAVGLADGHALDRDRRQSQLGDRPRPATGRRARPRAAAGRPGRRGRLDARGADGPGAAGGARPGSAAAWSPSAVTAPSRPCSTNGRACR